MSISSCAGAQDGGDSRTGVVSVRLGCRLRNYSSSDLSPLSDRPYPACTHIYTRSALVPQPPPSAPFGFRDGRALTECSVGVGGGGHQDSGGRAPPRILHSICHFASNSTSFLHFFTQSLPIFELNHRLLTISSTNKNQFFAFFYFPTFFPAIIIGREQFQNQPKTFGCIQM